MPFSENISCGNYKFEAWKLVSDYRECFIVDCGCLMFMQIYGFVDRGTGMQPR